VPETRQPPAPPPLPHSLAARCTKTPEPLYGFDRNGCTDSIGILIRANGGAPGVDGMTTEELVPWLREHWASVRQDLDAGTYRPSPVRRVVIPKPGGGERLLGVPTCLDRLICQAIAQVLTPIFDPGFSGSSFGFRPGRSAHQAVRAARRCIADGLEWVVDIDLDRFLDA
jgi:RNA-directed DNA polymerase